MVIWISSASSASERACPEASFGMKRFLVVSDIREEVVGSSPTGYRRNSRDTNFEAVSQERVEFPAGLSRSHL